MPFRRARKNTGVALIAGFLMGFDAILKPKGARIENVGDETRRKKEAQSGEPVNGNEDGSPGQKGRR